MADTKISALTSASLPLTGTEVLPIVQSGTTVKVANNSLRPTQVQSNATSGILQVAGPAAASTRVMTVPDANFTAARTDAAQTFTGDQTFSNVVAVLGNFLAGTSSTSIAGTNYGTLALAGRLVTNRNVDGTDSVFQSFGTAGALYVQGNGNCLNTNNSYGALSDIKLKENIVDTSPKLAQLNQVRIVNYNLIGDSNKQLGVIAQELEQVFPSMVDETVDRDSEDNDLGTTTKSVKYSVFVPMLIKAMQEQQVIIESINEKLKNAGVNGF